MKNVLSRSISLLLAVMLVCALSVSASASDMSTYASDYLSKYDGAVTAQGNGVIKISFRNPELSTTNSFSHADYVLYNGEVGKTYRAKITVFGNDDFRTFTTASTIATR